MKTNDTTNAVYSEETEMKNTAAQPETEKANKATAWRSILMGGIPGIVLGVLGDEAVEEAIAADVDPDKPVISPAEHAEISVATSVNDGMSFNEAFAAARSEVGPGGAFTWHGQVYSTYRADDPEWQNMTDEQRLEHSQNIISQVHPQPYHQVANNVSEGEDVTTVTPGEDDIHDEDDHGEVDVHIVGVEHVTADDGSVVSVGLGEINGMNAAFADTDGDGEVDTVLIDSDNNGEPDLLLENQHTGISVDGMIAEANHNSAITLDDNLYNDMPDYTNDADVNSLA